MTASIRIPFVGERSYSELLFLFLLLVFILADSRAAGMQVFRHLRYPLVMAIGAVALARSLPSISRELAVFLPFLVWSLATSVLSPTPTQAFLQACSYGIVIAIVFQWIRPLVWQKQGRPLVDLVYLCTVLLAVGLVLKFIAPGVTHLGGRFRGILGNPNGLGIFSAIFLPLQVLVFDRLLPERRTIKWISVGVLLVGMILSGSRNSLMTSTLFLALYYGLSGSGTRAALLLGLLFPLGLLLVTAVTPEEIATSLGLRDYLRWDRLSEGSGRVYAWSYALSVIKTSPWLGRGFGFDEYIFIPSNIPADVDLHSHQGAVHNSYLALLLNTGVIGLLLFGSGILAILRRFRFSPFIAGLTVAVAFSTVFESWIMSALNAFTITFLMSLVALEYVQVLSAAPHGGARNGAQTTTARAGGACIRART